MSKPSSVSRAHLSPHTYTAGVEWCGIGHEELCTSFTSLLHSWCGMVWYRILKLCTSFTSHLHSWCGMVWYRILKLCTSLTSHLHSWCGMVWYRSLRAVRIFHLTPTHLVWNGVVQDIKSCAHLSPHTYTAGVEWCGIGQ